MIYHFSLIEKLLLRFNIIPHPVYDGLINPTLGRALQTSIKLGLIDSLLVKEKTAKVVASERQISHRAAQALLECLTSTGYVSQTSNGAFALTKMGRKFLSPESPDNLRYFILFSDLSLTKLQNLERHAKTDGPTGKDAEITSLTEEEWEILTRAMIEMARVNAPAVARLLPIRPGHKILLDIGGSHGLYAIETAKRFPWLRADIMDFTPTKKYAEEMIDQNNITERVAFSSGNFLTEPIAKKYDVVFLFNVVHAYNQAVNLQLLKKIKSVLNNDGLCVILDQIKTPEQQSPLFQSFVAALGLVLFNQAGGQTYKLTQIEQWFIDTGFGQTQFKKLRMPGFGLMIAKN